MTRRAKEVASFDDLMRNRYGRPDKRLLRGAETAGDLFASYYGNLPQPAAEPRTSATLSLQCDDGRKMLAQRNRFADNGPGQGWMPPPAMMPLPPLPAEPPLPTPALPVTPLPVIPLPSDPPATAVPAAAAPAAVGPAPAGMAPQPAPGNIAPVPASPPANTAQPPVSQVASRYVHASDPAPATPSDDEFLADMQSIFSGTGVYNPLTKKTEPKIDRKEYPRSPDPGAANAAPPEPSDSQRIFDKIAQSMQYASTFDLGDIDLENRFADFDRLDDDQKQATARRKRGFEPPAPPRSAPPAELKPGTADFLADLDSIRKQAGNQGAAQVPVAGQMTRPDGYVAPFYDTGEHVLTGGDLYKDQLLVGKAPGLLLSYGDIIAMADLFQSAQQMMDEEAGTLRNIKRLVDQSTAYYRSGKSPAFKDVKNADWDDATGGRYLKLAEDNYTHFAPNILYKNAAFVKNTEGRNHQDAWEDYHERAIREAQRMALDPANANVSYIPVSALVLNAFGDHFLTDAFAAGHVINKAAIIDLFKAKFFSGGSLTKAGDQFFEKLAQKAWHGEVAAKFGQLETYESHLWFWHPDIKNADRFASVLKGAAEKEPDKIGNLVVKVIHDFLNKDGLEVVNAAGSPPWHLTGDGHMTSTSLGIMRQAVQASAAAIVDQRILVSNFDFGAEFARVWAYVPRLTPASETKVKNLVAAYVTPGSDTLATAAAEIIHDEVDSLIKALIDKKALQHQ